MKRFIFLGLYIVFWILSFALLRMLFLGINGDESIRIGLSEWAGCFIHGFRLDLSTTTYYVLGATVILIFTAPFKARFTSISILYYHFFLSFITALIAVMDLELYRYWGFRLDITPLIYLKTPGEAAASISIGECCLLLISFLIVTFILYWSYKRLIHPFLRGVRSGMVYIPLLLLAGALLIIPARGGTGTVPINLGSAYYHQNQFLNHAAINVVWNAIYSIAEKNKLDQKNEELIPKDQADSILTVYHEQKGRTEQWVQCRRPNIILIILESFSNKIIGSLDGGKGITPCFDSLARQGILFSNFYASGDRSDKGLVSLFSGFPAQPRTSIINYPNKTQNLPFLYEAFKKEGYHTSWYYGGNIEFANFSTYLNNPWMDRLISIEDFEERVSNAKWGIHDEVLFERVLRDLDRENRPFFLSLFTLSSHEPFEVPMQPKFGDSDRDDRSRNAFYYTDSCLGAFIRELKRKPYWDQTWVIVTADHGSRSPGNTANYELEKFRIPMLWLGGATDPDTAVINKTCAQSDLPAIMLGQLGLEHEAYPYSKDIFKDTVSCFAFYAFNNGFGIVNDSSYLIYDLSAQKRIAGRLTGNELSLGRALVRKIYDDYHAKGREPAE